MYVPKLHTGRLLGIMTLAIISMFRLSLIKISEVFMFENTQTYFKLDFDHHFALYTSRFICSILYLYELVPIL